ncbi:WASH complex subunit 4 [Diachasmimorpha longicaudata]|uniref:WASH complex subunit 4 n=1 Tax=Diachasmimorpha longicaudata TaxID=58733 RepID=UPI0030B8E2D6
MFETSGWSSSRDEEIHKAAGNVQLRKYGQFFSRLSRIWWEPSSSLEHVLEGPIRLVYRITECESLLSLSDMENKHLSKVLATVAGTCREIRELKSEFPIFYSKLLYNSEKNHQDNYSGFFGDLQDLSVFCNRISSVIHLGIAQLSSLTKSSNEIYLPVLIEHLIDLFVILVTLDEVIEAHQTLQENWRKYRIQVRTVMHNPQKFSLPENRLVTFDKLLKDLHAQLFTRNLFLRALEGVMNVSKTPVMNDHLLSYLRTMSSEIETKILSPHLIARQVVRMNVGIVLSTKLFGVCDKKLQKRMAEINKKIYGVTLVGNVLWVPSRYLAEILPKDFGNSVVTSQVGEKLLTAMIQKLPGNYGAILQRSMIWCMDARNLLSDSEFQIQDIKKQYSLLKQVVGLLQQMNEIVFTITNLHAELSKPMTRGTVQIICRLVEMEKTLESTLHFLGPNIVQAQGRSLQCLAYEILLILESARKGLIQKDQGYSRERLDALSLMSLAMRLIDTAPSSDRRLIARCALTISRQLADTFKDEDAVNLKQKLDDFDTIADLDTIISEACDYSVLLHHQSMIPAYLTSVAEADQDVSHVLHLLNAFNSAVVKTGRSEVTEVKVKDMKESLIKYILEPACREIETSLRLHVHAHLKLDSANPMKIGVKDGGRIVRSSPLPIANSLVSSKRFIEHYLDDMFYNLTTVALHDWKTYRTMHTLAKYKFGLETVQNHLPTQTLEQGLDALEIMRNIHVFVSKYLYNLNTQTFVEHTSANKHLNTIGIRHIANSIRTHGTGIMSTTVNFVYQFLRVKLHTFSQFLFDEHIKSRLLRDIRFIRSQRERDDVPYTYERAEKFQKGIRKLGMSPEGLSYLDHFRQLITQIGTALGYVRLIRSGGLHASANAVSFLPEIKSSAHFENACDGLEYSATTRAAAKRLDDDIGNLVRNFTEGIQYFKLLVDVFASSFRDSKSFHLQQFYAIIPPLTLSFVDNAVANKEKIFKKNKDGAAFTDDGFAMGVAYINALLDQDAELDGLQWFETVNRHFSDEKMAAEVRADGGDEKLQQTKALTLKRIAQRTAEFQLLYYSLSGARVFFKQPEG